MREESLLPARQENVVEFESLGAMQGHEADHVAAGLGGVLHHQADVIEKAREAIELGHRGNQFFEVFEPARRVGRFIRLPHAGIARFIEDLRREIGMRGVVEHSAPAIEIGDEVR